MKQLYIAILAIACFGSCRESYDPPVAEMKKSFLVIEANLDPGPAPATVLLSRTSGLETRTGTVYENGAHVFVEGKDGSVYVFTGGASRGVYQANLNLSIGSEYRLRITTRDGSQYVSDYVIAKQTPPIDSVGWDREPDGLQVHVNTKDPAGNSIYYRWNYDETWEIRSNFSSTYIYDNGRVRDRVFPGEDVSVCWKYDTSATILLGNSSRLQNDLIHKAPLVFIPNGSEKLAVRYSMMVRQYVLDKKGYEFFDLIKKNTEEIGSLFNPQPSEVRGNITCSTNPAEYVLGYVTASTVQQKRVFIKIAWPFIIQCLEISVPDNPDSLRAAFGGGAYIPYTMNEPPKRYMASTANCVDCRSRGGNLAKPLFW